MQTNIRFVFETTSNFYHLVLKVCTLCAICYHCLIFVYFGYSYSHYLSVTVDSDDDDSDSEMETDPQQVCSH